MSLTSKHPPKIVLLEDRFPRKRRYLQVTCTFEAQVSSSFSCCFGRPSHWYALRRSSETENPVQMRAAFFCYFGHPYLCCDLL